MSWNRKVDFKNNEEQFESFGLNNFFDTNDDKDINWNEFFNLSDDDSFFLRHPDQTIEDDKINI